MFGPASPFSCSTASRVNRFARRPTSPSSVAREQHRLAVGPQHLEDARDVGQEAHVEHAVGLVEHAGPHAVEPQQLARHEVEQPAGGGDHDVGVPGALGLRTDADAAVDRRHLQVAHVGDRAELLGDLARQLARGRRGSGRSGSRPLGCSRSTSGTANASVLPEPVRERASTSRPASASGSTSDWIANGRSKPRMRRASATGSETPSVSEGRVGRVRGRWISLLQRGSHGAVCPLLGRRSVRVEGRRLCAGTPRKGGACEGSRDFVARASRSRSARCLPMIRDCRRSSTEDAQPVDAPVVRGRSERPGRTRARPEPGRRSRRRSCRRSPHGRS